jgi:hypothetical protein
VIHQLIPVLFLSWIVFAPFAISSSNALFILLEKN